MLCEAKHTNYTRKSVMRIFIIRPKIGPDLRKKNLKHFFNVAISLDHYSKDFKFSGYEGRIHRKIRPIQLKTKMIWSGLQWVFISHLSVFMLILDDDISV